MTWISSTVCSSEHHQRFQSICLAYKQQYIKWQTTVSLLRTYAKIQSSHTHTHRETHVQCICNVIGLLLTYLLSPLNCELRAVQNCKRTKSGGDAYSLNFSRRASALLFSLNNKNVQPWMFVDMAHVKYTYI